MKHLKYWILVLIINYGSTITVHLLLHPLWFIKVDEHTKLTILETFFTILILPVSLVLINAWLAKKYPGYTIVSRGLKHAGRSTYDVNQVLKIDGQTITVYLDITNFFGKK